MSPRFVFDCLVTVAAAFLVAVALTFSSGTAGWIGFGVSVAILIASLVSIATASHRAQRVNHGLLGLLAVWAGTAALVFSGGAQTWLLFANAIAIGALALLDQMMHEVSTERVVHSLEVREATETARAASA